MFAEIFIFWVYYNLIDGVCSPTQQVATVKVYGYVSRQKAGTLLLIGSDTC